MGGLDHLSQPPPPLFIHVHIFITHARMYACVLYMKWLIPEHNAQTGHNFGLETAACA